MSTRNYLSIKKHLPLIAFDIRSLSPHQTNRLHPVSWRLGAEQGKALMLLPVMVAQICEGQAVG